MDEMIKPTAEERLKVFNEYKDMNLSTRQLARLVQGSPTMVSRMKKGQWDGKRGRKFKLSSFQQGVLIEGLRISRWKYTKVLKFLGPAMPFLPSRPPRVGIKQLNMKTLYLLLKEWEDYQPYPDQPGSIAAHIIKARFDESLSPKKSSTRQKDPFFVLCLLDRNTEMIFLQAFRHFRLHDLLKSIGEFKRMFGSVPFNSIGFVKCNDKDPDILSVLDEKEYYVKEQVKTKVATTQARLIERELQRRNIAEEHRSQYIGRVVESINDNLQISFEQSFQVKLGVYTLPCYHRSIRDLNKKLQKLTNDLNRTERDGFNKTKALSPVSVLTAATSYWGPDRERFKQGTRMGLV